MNRILKFFIISIITIQSFIIFNTLVACVSQLQFQYRAVDEPLKPYVNDYFKLLEKYCPEHRYYKTDNYVIELVEDLDKDTWIGVCDSKFNGYHIQIKSLWWEKAPDYLKRELIYHEMAHCVIFQSHIDDIPHYMNTYFTPLSEITYTKQAIQDIKNYCASK